ncbi:PfkB family carbohydrate kinase [Limosilactobacillus fermentum]|uniref:Ribokinase n=1 Tax=Limosilactobacillus fermentum TaxID=1613 RepID=A0A158SLI5_LIMFE|nr:PfkB family carbohydrate kinase [Limosilactobacillus fermentum]MPQ35947.1 ribokinase [Limosilactobacillus fermentum]CDN25664.1 putative kinase [Limosilactobacillus fermentum]SJM46855.1 Ribokinase [Limosilactobacillus fermentum]SJM55605.1 Ribokinase [Limosilactobacillus fermentum]
MIRSLIIGAAFVDVLMAVPKLPTTGEDVSGHFRCNIVGGSAFNVYGAVKYAGESADLFVPVGEGQYADVVRMEMARRKMPVQLSVSGADNGWDISFVEPNGERSFLTVNGIEQLWQDAWFKQINIVDYDYFYISGYEMEAEQAADVILQALANRKPETLVVFDASPRIQYIPQATIERLLSPGVLIHCNQDEINTIIPGQSSLEAKCHQIFSKTQTPVVVTLGERGAYFFAGDDSGIVSPVQAKVVNTLGAGDTFCGGLIAGLTEGLSVRSAITKANQLAGLVVGQESGTLLDRS